LLIQMMGLAGRVLDQVFFQLLDEVLLGMVLDGLLAVKEETLLPIQTMGLIGQVLVQPFLQMDMVLLGLEIDGLL